MASKSINMTLSLNDKATPELERFKASLKGLEALLGTINKSFQGFNAGMASMGESSVGAATAMGGTTQAATALESKMAQAAAAMRAFAGAAGEAGAMAGLAGREINQAGGQVETFERKMHSLGSTIRGVGELWAAAKIGQGLEKSVETASEMQNAETRVRNIGGPEVQALVRDAVAKARKELPEMKRTDLTAMALDVYAATGHKESIADLAELAKSVYVMKKSDASGSFGEQSTLNTFKALELRGSMLDPKRRDDDMEQMMKASIATQGRIGPDQFFMFLKTLKTGESQAFDKSFFPMATALMEEMGASRAATMINAMQRTVSGSQIKKELIPNWKELGLLSKDGRSMDHYDEFRANPIAFIQKYVLPALEKKGVDTTNESEIAKASTKLFGNQNGQDGLYASIARMEQLKKQAELIESVSGKEAAYNEITKNASAGLERFKSAMDELGQKIGAVVLPVLSEFLEFMVKIVDFFSGAAEDPVVAWGLTITGVFASAVLALKGFLSVFGFLAPAVGGATGAASGAMLGFVAKFGVWGAIAVAEFTAVFVFYDAIKNFEVFGTTIEDVFNQSIAYIIGQFSRMLTFLQAGLLSFNKSVASSVESGARSVGMDWLANKAGEYKNAISGAQAENLMSAKNTQEWVNSFSRGSELQAKKTLAAKGEAGFDAGPGAGGHDGWGADAKHGSGRPSPKWSNDGGGKAGGGRARAPNENDIAARIEANDAQFARDKLALELRATEALYKDHVIGIEALTAKKVEVIKAGVAGEIAALEREKAILSKDSTKNADKINAVNHKIELASLKEKQDLLDVEYQKKQAIESIEKDGIAIQERLDNITKSGSKAKIALLDIEYQKKRKILEINGQLAAAQALDDLHMREVAKVGYDAEKRKADMAKSMERTAEMGANADAKSGVITSYEAQQKIIDAKREQGRQELINLDAMDRFAEKIKDPEILESLKQQRIEAQGLVDTLDLGAQQFKDTMHSAIEGGLNDLMKGKFSFKKFFSGIADMMNQTLTKGLADTITNALFGKEGMFAGAGSGGGMIASMFGGGGQSQGGGLGGFFSSLFGGGGGAGAAASGEGGGFLSGIGSFFSNLLSFDVGADSIPRDMIARIHKDEMILPAETADKVRKGLSGGSGGSGGGSKMNQTVNFNMNTTPDRRTRDQMSKQIGDAARRAGQRNG
ncbi:hypothetical protein LXA47_31395 [Massilia sp. P8910]|uniref:hypothetical protein n=1 Tax=Massilia antarctica TaxID=2765360 RepID=UPI001E57AB9B|nr:hypothetical protein [Massilia antarctica]MCE3608077.1 hypothetical protein [Massilia antarctica]